MKKRQRRQEPQEEYSYEQLREEREYGLFWYSWLWNILRPILVILCVTVIVVGIFATGWHFISARYVDPVDASSTAAVTFEVKSGSSLTRVANNLEAAGLVRNRSVFKYYADFLGYGQKIQAGTYTLSPSMTLREIAEQLTRGDGTPLVRRITIIEGWTVQNIAAYLKREGVISDEEQFLSLCRTGEQFSAYYYIADVRASANFSQRIYALEGYLFPDTYEIYSDESAESIIGRMLTRFGQIMGDEYTARAAKLNMSVDDVITLASLIEKEARHENDFTRVSAVFHLRLDKGMKLQSDAPLKYIFHTSGVLTFTAEQMADTSLYNTHVYEGLPLGPIANPGRKAIEAALYPDEEYMNEGYLYFCLMDSETGELIYAKTLEEHNANVAKYRPNW